MTRVEPAPSPATRDEDHSSSGPGGALAVVGDHALELVTWLIAWWTLLYWAGWALGTSLWPLGWLWLGTSLLAVVGTVVVGVVRPARRRREGVDRPTHPVQTGGPSDRPDSRPEEGDGPWHHGPDEADDTDDTDGGDSRPAWDARRVLDVAPGLVALACAVLLLVAVGPWPRSGFALLWGLPVLALLAGAVSLLVGRRSRSGVDLPVAPGRWEHLVVAAIALATGVLSLFIHLPDHDDPYYVNRSVWIAEHGTALVRDTIYGPGTYVSPYNGGIPVASIEALVGVLSHLTGVSVGSLTWLVSTFLGAVGTVWAFWALSRRWAPRLPLVVLVVSVVFMLLSGESRLGNFWIARMWQGKVIALTVLLPMIWVWADDLVRRGDRRRLLTLLVAGIAFVGLTSTAVILVPFVTGGIVVAGLVLRRGRLTLGGVLLAVGPVVSGLVVLVLSTGVGANGALRDGPETFRRVLGPNHWMVVVALAAIALAPFLLRGRHVALMVTATLLASLVVLWGPLLRLAADLTGAGPILWRVLYCVPIAVLVGLLAVWRPRRATGSTATTVSAVVPVLLLASLLGAGAPLWTTVDHNGPVTLTSRPTWKVDETALREVDAVMATSPRGVVLLPPKAMEVMPMVTTEAYAVDPRSWYTRILEEPRAQHQARRALARWIREKPGRPQGAALRQALRRLDVSLVCVKDARASRAVPQLRAAGYGQRSRLADMTCVRPG